MIKRRAIFLIFALLILLPAFADDDLVSDYFDIAKNYCQSGKQAKAIEYLDYILKIDPNNTEAKTLRLQIIALAPVPEGSANLPAPTPEEISQTAQMLGTQQNIEKFTILDINKADTEKMDYNEFYYNQKGMALYKDKNYDSAAEYFFKAIRLNKRFAQAYNNLGMVYRMKNSPNLAIKYFKKAYRLNKNYSQPLVNLALAYKQTGNEKAELKYFQKALKINPTDYWAYYLLGDFYKARGDYANAVENYQNAIVVKNDFKEAYLQLGICFIEGNHTLKAQSALNRYVELAPASDFGIYLLAKLNAATGQYSTAKELIEKAILINPAPEYYLAQAKIDFALKNYNKSLEEFERLSENITSADIYNFIGLCYYKTRETDKAIINFNKAIMLDNTNAMFYYNLAQCYKTKGENASYMKFFRAATSIQPVTVQDYLDLSTIYMDNKNANFAINMLNSGILKFPDEKDLYLAKQKIFEIMGDGKRYGEVQEQIDKRFKYGKKD